MRDSSESHFEFMMSPRMTIQVNSKVVQSGDQSCKIDAGAIVKKLINSLLRTVQASLYTFWRISDASLAVDAPADNLEGSEFVTADFLGSIAGSCQNFNFLEIRIEQKNGRDHFIVTSRLPIWFRVESFGYSGMLPDVVIEFIDKRCKGTSREVPCTIAGIFRFFTVFL